MENKNIIYIPGRGISKAHFVPPTVPERPAMPKKVTFSGTFTLSGNPNRLFPLFQPRILKCYKIETSVLAIGDSRPQRVVLGRVTSYRDAVRVMRLARKESRRSESIVRANVKIKKCKIRLPL